MCAWEFSQQRDPFSFRRNYSRQKQSRSFLPCFSSQLRHFTSRSPPISRTKKHGDSKTMAVVLFAIFGLVGLRVPSLLIVGYLLHGVWDVLHEVHAFGGTDFFGAHRLTELPLAYGAFCAAYDWCMAGHFYTRRRDWNAALKARDR